MPSYILHSAVSNQIEIPVSWRAPFRGDYLLVVGNGLTLDLLQFLDPNRDGISADWNTLKPLSWPIKTPGKPDELLMNQLPDLKSFVNAKRRENPSVNDFTLFQDIFTTFLNGMMSGGLIGNESGEEVLRQAGQVQQYLALAFTRFMEVVATDVRINRRSLSQWKWAQLLKRIAPRLGIIVSFNYDIVVENLLDTLGYIATRFGIWNESKFLKDRRGIRMFKPHGSIEYEIGSGALGLNHKYPLDYYFAGFDGPIRRLEYDNLYSVRTFPGLVAPNEQSIQLDVQWVGPAYDHLRHFAPQFKTCIFAGIAYGEYDRIEFDFIIDKLEKTTRVVIDNPYPPVDMIKKCIKSDLKNIQLVGARKENRESLKVELGKDFDQLHFSTTLRI